MPFVEGRAAYAHEPGATESTEVPRIRTDELRKAFNTPFWPYVLATTSVGQEGSTFMLGATRSSTGTCAGTLWTLSKGKAGFNGTAGSPSAARLCVSWEQTSGPNAKPEKAPGRQFSVWPNNVWPTNPAWPWLALSRYALLIFLEVGPGEPTNRHASIVLQFQEELSSRRIPAFDLSLHRGSDLLGAHNEG